MTAAAFGKRRTTRRGRTRGPAGRWDRSDHPRGRGGRFARTGGGGAAAPRKGSAAERRQIRRQRIAIGVAVGAYSAAKAGLLFAPHIQYRLQRDEFTVTRRAQARQEQGDVDKVAGRISKSYGVRHVNLRGLTHEEARGVEAAVARQYRDFPDTVRRLDRLSTNTPFKLWPMPFAAVVQYKRDPKTGGVRTHMHVQPPWVAQSRSLSMKESPDTRARGRAPFMSAMHQTNPTRWMDTVITHEFGHVLAANGEAARIAYIKGEGHKRAPGEQSVMRRIVMTPSNPGLHDAWAADRSRWIAEEGAGFMTARSGPKETTRPTIYGLSNAGEYFAENFAIRRTQPEGLDHHPDTQRWIDWYAQQSRRHEATRGVRKALAEYDDVDESGWVWLPGYPAVPMSDAELAACTNHLNAPTVAKARVGPMRRPGMRRRGTANLADFDRLHPRAAGGKFRRTAGMHGPPDRPHAERLLGAARVRPKGDWDSHPDLWARHTYEVRGRNFSTELTNVGRSDLGVSIYGVIHDRQGAQIGKFSRTINTRAHKVHHDVMEVDAAHQGKGIARAFYAWNEHAYHQAGIRTISLDANVSVGAYSWAVAGFDFADGPQGRADRMMTRRRLLDYASAPSLEYSDAVARNLQNRMDRELDRRDQRKIYDTVDTPAARRQARALYERGDDLTPWDVAHIGVDGPHTTLFGHPVWAGKMLLLEQYWYGEKAVATDTFRQAIRAGIRPRLPRVRKARPRPAPRLDAATLAACQAQGDWNTPLDDWDADPPNWGPRPGSVAKRRGPWRRLASQRRVLGADFDRLHPRGPGGHFRNTPDQPHLRGLGPARKPPSPDALRRERRPPGTWETNPEGWARHTFQIRGRGFSTNVESVTKTMERSVLVRGTIRDGDGYNIGFFTRDIKPGYREAHHDVMKIEEPALRGRGISRAFYAWSEHAYRQAGLEKITLYANLSTGGYAWAVSGFDFDDDHGDNDDRETLRRKLSFYKKQGDLAGLPGMSSMDDEMDPDDRRALFDRIDTRRARAEAKAAAARDDLSPWDISRIGFDGPHANYGGHPVWAGKLILLGSDWSAVKDVTDDGWERAAALGVRPRRSPMLRKARPAPRGLTAAQLAALRAQGDWNAPFDGWDDDQPVWAPRPRRRVAKVRGGRRVGRPLGVGPDRFQERLHPRGPGGTFRTKPGQAKPPYREGGSFTHDGARYDLNRALKATQGRRSVKMKVDDLSWVLAHDRPDPRRVRAANLSAPVLVAAARDGRPTVVDGLHRLARAKAEGRRGIRARVLTPGDLDAASVGPGRVLPHKPGSLAAGLAAKRARQQALEGAAAGRPARNEAMERAFRGVQQRTGIHVAVGAVWDERRSPTPPPQRYDGLKAGHLAAVEHGIQAAERVYGRDVVRRSVHRISFENLPDGSGGYTDTLNGERGVGRNPHGVRWQGHISIDPANIEKSHARSAPRPGYGSRNVAWQSGSWRMGSPHDAVAQVTFHEITHAVHSGWESARIDASFWHGNALAELRIGRRMREGALGGAVERSYQRDLAQHDALRRRGAKAWVDNPQGPRRQARVPRSYGHYAVTDQAEYVAENATRYAFGHPDAAPGTKRWLVMLRHAYDPPGPVAKAAARPGTVPRPRRPFTAPYWLEEPPAAELKRYATPQFLALRRTVAKIRGGKRVGRPLAMGPGRRYEERLHPRAAGGRFRAKPGTEQLTSHAGYGDFRRRGGHGLAPNVRNDDKRALGIEARIRARRGVEQRVAGIDVRRHTGVVVDFDEGYQVPARHIRAVRDGIIVAHGIFGKDRVNQAIRSKITLGRVIGLGDAVAGLTTTHFDYDKHRIHQEVRIDPDMAVRNNKVDTSEHYYDRVWWQVGNKRSGSGYDAIVGVTVHELTHAVHQDWEGARVKHSDRAITMIEDFQRRSANPLGGEVTPHYADTLWDEVNGNRSHRRFGVYSLVSENEYLAENVARYALGHPDYDPQTPTWIRILRRRDPQRPPTGLFGKAAPRHGIEPIETRVPPYRFGKPDRAWLARYATPAFLAAYDAGAFDEPVAKIRGGKRVGRPLAMGPGRRYEERLHPRGPGGTFRRKPGQVAEARMAGGAKLTPQEQALHDRIFGGPKKDPVEAMRHRMLDRHVDSFERRTGIRVEEEAGRDKYRWDPRHLRGIEQGINHANELFGETVVHRAMRGHVAIADLSNHKGRPGTTGLTSLQMTTTRRGVPGNRWGYDFDVKVRIDPYGVEEFYDKYRGGDLAATGELRSRHRPWRSGSYRFGSSQDALAATTLHEIVHAVQYDWHANRLTEKDWTSVPGHQVALDTDRFSNEFRRNALGGAVTDDYLTHLGRSLIRRRAHDPVNLRRRALRPYGHYATTNETEFLAENVTRYAFGHSDYAAGTPRWIRMLRDAHDLSPSVAKTAAEPTVVTGWTMDTIPQGDGEPSRATLQRYATPEFLAAYYAHRDDDLAKRRGGRKSRGRRGRRPGVLGDRLFREDVVRRGPDGRFAPKPGSGKESSYERRRRKQNRRRVTRNFRRQVTRSATGAAAGLLIVGLATAAQKSRGASQTVKWEPSGKHAEFSVDPRRPGLGIRTQTKDERIRNITVPKSSGKGGMKRQPGQESVLSANTQHLYSHPDLGFVGSRSGRLLFIPNPEGKYGKKVERHLNKAIRVGGDVATQATAAGRRVRQSRPGVLGERAGRAVGRQAKRGVERLHERAERTRAGRWDRLRREKEGPLRRLGPGGEQPEDRATRRGLPRPSVIPIPGEKPARPMSPARPTSLTRRPTEGGGPGRYRLTGAKSPSQQKKEANAAAKGYRKVIREEMTAEAARQRDALEKAGVGKLRTPPEKGGDGWTWYHKLPAAEKKRLADNGWISDDGLTGTQIGKVTAKRLAAEHGGRNLGVSAGRDDWLRATRRIDHANKMVESGRIPAGFDPDDENGPNWSPTAKRHGFKVAVTGAGSITKAGTHILEVAAHNADFQRELARMIRAEQRKKYSGPTRLRPGLIPGRVPGTGRVGPVESSPRAKVPKEGPDTARRRRPTRRVIEARARIGHHLNPVTGQWERRGDPDENEPEWVVVKPGMYKSRRVVVKSLGLVLKHPGHPDQGAHGRRRSGPGSHKPTGHKPGGRTGSKKQPHDERGRFTTEGRRRRQQARREAFAAAAGAAVGIGATAAVGYGLGRLGRRPPPPASPMRELTREAHRPPALPARRPAPTGSR